MLLVFGASGLLPSYRVQDNHDPFQKIGGTEPIGGDGSIFGIKSKEAVTCHWTRL